MAHQQLSGAERSQFTSFTKRLQQTEKSNLTQPLDDFKEKVCHSHLREYSFQTFWEGALGMPPIDLNTLTTNQFKSIGELVSMNSWDGTVLWDGTVYTPLRGGNMLSDRKGNYCHGLQPIKKGKYFKVVIWYNINDDKKEYRLYFCGLTEDFRFFDASYKDAKDEPAAAYELRELFKIGSFWDNLGRKPIIPSPDCDKFKKEHCNGWLESYNKPFRELWHNVWGLPPIDFNTLNYAQVGSIGMFLGYNNYGELTPRVKRGKDYYAIVDRYPGSNYACGLTSDYYFFEDDNYVDYEKAAKEMMELFPEEFEKRRTHDDEMVMRALGGLWGGKVTVDGNVYKIKHPSYFTGTDNAIWRLSEYYDDNGMRHLHCDKRERDGGLIFYNPAENSYLKMGFEKKLVKWQEEAEGKAAAEFIHSYDEGVKKQGEPKLTEEQKAIVDGLRERGKKWLEVWKVRREIRNILFEQGQKARKKNLSSRISRVNYGVEDTWVRDKVAELLLQEKFRGQPEYMSVLTGVMHNQPVIVVEKKRW